MHSPAPNRSDVPPVRSLHSAAIVAASILLLGQLCLDAQQPTIAVNVKVVNVLATVRDQHGQIINNLSKDDFILQEDGRPQDIHYFSRESDLPLTLTPFNLPQTN